MTPAIAVSTQFIRAARTQLAATGGCPCTSSSIADKTNSNSNPVQDTLSALSFKATVLDENSNLVFEGGERIRVRIDLVNGGEQELQGVTATLTGTASLLAQFPTTTLAVGRLQPGQSRSIEFVATLPQAIQQQKAEIHVTSLIQEPVLSRRLKPWPCRSNLPASMPTTWITSLLWPTGFRQPHTYLISIGVGSYRDQQVPSRKFASPDAEMVSNYFQSLGGLPASNVRLLQDWKALRPDIDEALLDWLPPHMNRRRGRHCLFRRSGLGLFRRERRSSCRTMEPPRPPHAHTRSRIWRQRCHV